MKILVAISQVVKSLQKCIADVNTIDSISTTVLWLLMIMCESTKSTLDY